MVGNFKIANSNLIKSKDLVDIGSIESFSVQKKIMSKSSLVESNQDVDEIDQVFEQPV
jgi:hypothetical protein